MPPPTAPPQLRRSGVDRGQDAATDVTLRRRQLRVAPMDAEGCRHLQQGQPRRRRRSRHFYAIARSATTPVERRAFDTTTTLVQRHDDKCTTDCTNVSDATSLVRRQSRWACGCRCRQVNDVGSEAARRGRLDAATPSAATVPVKQYAGRRHEPASDATGGMTPGP